MENVLNLMDLVSKDRTIKILAYNLETVMFEKIETVITRGDQIK